MMQQTTTRIQQEPEIKSTFNKVVDKKIPMAFFKRRASNDSSTGGGPKPYAAVGHGHDDEDDDDVNDNGDLYNEEQDNKKMSRRKSPLQSSITQNSLPELSTEEDDFSLAPSSVGQQSVIDKYGFIQDVDDSEVEGSVLTSNSSQNNTATMTANNTTTTTIINNNHTAASKSYTEKHKKKPSVMGVPKRRMNKNFARQGIAHHARKKAWLAIPNVDALMEKSTGQYFRLVDQAATTILELSSSANTRRRSSLNSTRSLDWWDTLERDLGRTFPKHYLFQPKRGSMFAEGSRGIEEGGEGGGEEEEESDAFEEVARFAVEGGGQAALRRVLRAYSTYDPDVGYCQGMNFIAAMMLMVMDDEETAFWMFSSVMQEDIYNLRGLFLRDMEGTQEVLYVAEKLIQQFLPKLHQHFEEHHIQVSMILTPWLMTIYTRNFPFELVLRVWDSFLVEGWKVVYRTMLALLEDAQPTLLEQDFDGILMYLREFTSSVDGPHIMLSSLKISLRTKHIQKYTAEWKARHKKGEMRVVDTTVFNRLNSTDKSEVVSSMGMGSFIDT